MGLDYALVHLTYTIPPAVLLTCLYAPLWTRLDTYKVGFLVLIAVVSTIPWDSYLIRTGVWSYPPNVVFGLTLFDIPIEEVFFFVVQTYNTSLLYLILSKPLLPSAYLVKESSKDQWRYVKLIGQLVIGLGIKQAYDFVRNGDKNTYLGLILIWAGPFLWLLWSLAYQFLVRLPPTSTIVPIALPTLYLWIVDTLALKRGTWVIATGTKTGLTLWPGLEIEEAIFFLLTNCLIVFGQVAFDNALAVLYAFPAVFPHVSTLPSPLVLVQALLLPAKAYDDDRVLGFQQSVDRLQRKSRSFYLANATFQGRLRLDLITLYSFCRIADDLIDNAASVAEAREWVRKLTKYLDLSYGQPIEGANGAPVKANDSNRGAATVFVAQQFPAEAQLTLLMLPTSRLSKKPLYELLKGFEMDLAFEKSDLSGPIKCEADADLYSARVAGTVALLCIELVLYHHPSNISSAHVQELLAAGHDMGIALQYTNIARDLTVDARTSRCYVPPSWLKKEKLTVSAFVDGLSKDRDQTSNKSDNDEFFAKKVEIIRMRLLDRAVSFYSNSVDAIEDLPIPARGPMRVAVESYMQIGREMRKPGFKRKAGRATVPRWKRIWVAWRMLIGPSKRSGEARRAR